MSGRRDRLDDKPQGGLCQAVFNRLPFDGPGPHASGASGPSSVESTLNPSISLVAAPFENAVNSVYPSELRATGEGVNAPLSCLPGPGVPAVSRRPGPVLSVPGPFPCRSKKGSSLCPGRPVAGAPGSCGPVSRPGPSSPLDRARSPRRAVRPSGTVRLGGQSSGGPAVFSSPLDESSRGRSLAAASSGLLARSIEEVTK